MIYYMTFIKRWSVHYMLKLIKKLSKQIKGVMALLILVINTLIFFIPILFLGLIKLIPYTKLKIFCTKAVDTFADTWAGINNLYISFQPTQWNIQGIESLPKSKWYFLIANHQSWLDIVVLQHVFNRKIPTLKFFIKDQLKWIPFLGFAWWAMGCPFMKRYSPQYIQKYPHKKGRDLARTLKAIKFFKKTPASIISFIEGSLYTKEKATLQQSPYQHLLKTKYGGLSYVLGSMSDKIKQLIDVTIIYEGHSPTLWDFLTDKIQTIHVIVRQIPIPTELLSPELFDSKLLQEKLKEWLDSEWRIKDTLIQQMTEKLSNTLSKGSLI